MLSLCDRIDALIKTEKVKGPTTCLIFLVLYILNTDTMEVSVCIECKTSLLTSIHSFCTLKNKQNISYWQIVLHMQSGSSRLHFSYAGLLNQVCVGLVS